MEMVTKPIQPATVSDKLIDRWEQVCQKLAALAEEFPESKFDYQAADGVRTFADVLRHVAFWNQYVADSARGRKADDSANELPKDRFSTKKQILAELRRSAADALDALRASLSDLKPETAELVITFIEHNCEHYGQLVVYARLNGVVPPASRG
jgi:uncharacterized damage-inducible protein DinB